MAVRSITVMNVAHSSGLQSLPSLVSYLNRASLGGIGKVGCMLGNNTVISALITTTHSCGTHLEVITLISMYYYLQLNLFTRW